VSRAGMLVAKYVQRHPGAPRNSGILVTYAGKEFGIYDTLSWDRDCPPVRSDDGLETTNSWDMDTHEATVDKDNPATLRIKRRAFK